MTLRCFSPSLLAVLGAALLAAPPASAKDFLNNLARQAVGSAVQAVSRQAAAQVATPSAPAAPAAASKATYVRAGAQPPRMRLEDGTVFYADYIVDYWSRPDAVTRGGTPDLDAPGHIFPRPAKFGAGKKSADYAALQRKLEKVMARVMEHPALHQIRGASLRWGADFATRRGRARTSSS